MEDKNKNKLPATMKAAIFFVAIGFLDFVLGARTIGIICLLMGGGLLFTTIGAKKHEKEANDLMTIVNNDPSYAHDKEVLNCLEKKLQSIKDNLPEKTQASYFEKRMGDPNQFIAFGKEAIEKGALMVLSTQNGANTQYSWHVFTNHIYAFINGGLYSVSQSPDIYTSAATLLFSFRCHKVAIEERTTYKTNASVGGRAVAGAAIAGPVGAVVGAISAADKNNTGGVTKTKSYIAGYNYYIKFKNEHVEAICINDKALGETKEDMESFLTHDLHWSNFSGDIILNLKKIKLSKDNKYKLTSILSNILKNIQNAQ